MSAIYTTTPLLRQVFNKLNAPQVFVKYESFQPSGSFKIRGIGNLISKKAKAIRESSKKEPMVFSSSGGNAGLAAAVASQRLGIACTVVIPMTTKDRMADKIRSCNANVIVKGSHWKEADTRLKEIIAGNYEKSDFEPVYVHPFDDPILWEGHATIVDEIVDTLNDQNIPLQRIKGIVCSVGGGGLYNGIIQGLEKRSLADKIPIIAVETRGCHVLNASLQNEKLIRFDKVSSVATSLCSSYISAETFHCARKYGSKSVVLEDKDVLQTCLKFADGFNMITEPACGASIHLGYNPKIVESALGQKLSGEDIIIVVACGGSSTTMADLQANMQSISNL